MNIFEAVLLGIVQGLTEFLPVSSSGHLVVFQKLIGQQQHNIVFDVSVHLGTVLSILTIYFYLFRQFLKEGALGLKERKMNRSLHLLLLIVVANIPTAIIGLSLKEIFESFFDSSFHVGIFFVVTGFVLFFTKWKVKGESLGKNLNLDAANEISLKQAIILGVAQGAAIAPGISRSGATIATGILIGVERNSAAMFSFLMSIPAILGASLLQIRKITDFQPEALTVLAVGLLSAYLAGLFGLWLVLKVVKKGRLEVFSYYLWCLGGLLIFWW